MVNVHLLWLFGDKESKQYSWKCKMRNFVISFTFSSGVKTIQLKMQDEKLYDFIYIHLRSESRYVENSSELLQVHMEKQCRLPLLMGFNSDKSHSFLLLLGLTTGLTLKSGTPHRTRKVLGHCTNSLSPTWSDVSRRMWRSPFLPRSVPPPPKWFSL